MILHIDVPPLQTKELQDQSPTESSTIVRQRVMKAYDKQMLRQQCLNQALSPNFARTICSLDENSAKKSSKWLNSDLIFSIAPIIVCYVGNAPLRIWQKVKLSQAHLN